MFRGEDGNLYVNRLGAASLAGQEMVRYHYDGRGDLTAVYGRGGKKLRGFAYRNHIMIEHSQPEGLVSRRTQGHIGSVYEYDPRGRLKRQQTHALGEGGKQDVQVGAVSRRYAYDRAGNLIRSEDRRGGTLEYVYDKLGRIREAKHSGGSVERFAFDPAGNILSANHPAATSAGRLKSQPQKTPSNPNLYAGNRLKEHDGTEYTYDGLGNLIYRQLPDGENQYFQYDSENQLVRAEIKKAAGNTEIWEYAYDPFGRRLSKERKDKLAWTSTEPKRIHFVWDGSRLAQEYTYKGTYTYIYTDQDSYEPLAQIFHNNKDGKQYLAYIHTDQIGIPREMTDQFGNLLWYGEYTAWGRLKKDGRVYQNAHQPFRLQNQYYDRETGLHYNLMRYYEPDTGRFVNQDPIGLWGGENLYAFAPNAQAWVDPLGLANLFDIGTYGSLNSSAHVGDGLQAHELIRHEALVQSGYTTKNNRLSQNPAIALDLDHHTRGPAKDTRGIGGTHHHEAEIRRSHYGLGRNDMHSDLHREIDIAQGGLRKTGTPKAQRKRLRRATKKFLRKLKNPGKKCP